MNKDCDCFSAETIKIMHNLIEQSVAEQKEYGSTIEDCGLKDIVAGEKNKVSLPLYNSTYHTHPGQHKDPSAADIRLAILGHKEWFCIGTPDKEVRCFIERSDNYHQSMKQRMTDLDKDLTAYWQKMEAKYGDVSTKGKITDKADLEEGHKLLQKRLSLSQESINHIPELFDICTIPTAQSEEELPKEIAGKVAPVTPEVTTEVKFSRPMAGSKGGYAIMDYKTTTPITDEVAREQIINAYNKVKSPIGYATYNAIKKETGLPYETILGVLKQEYINDPRQIHFNVDRMGKNVFFKYDKKPAIPKAEAGIPIAKEPWQMTREKYISNVQILYQKYDEPFPLEADYYKIEDPDIDAETEKAVLISKPMGITGLHTRKLWIPKSQLVLWYRKGEWTPSVWVKKAWRWHLNK